MRARIGISLVGVGLVAAAAAFFARQQSKAPILLIGDSLGVGLATSLQTLGLPLQSIAADRTNVDIEYWAITADTKLKAALTPKTTMVVVSLGFDDAYKPSTYASIAADFTRELLALLTSNGAQVIWIGPPKLPASYDGRSLHPEVLEAIRQVVDATDGAIWLDNSNVNLPRQDDNLHPTSEGYSAWAKLLVAVLSDFFVSPGPIDSKLGDDEPAPEPPRPPPPSIVTAPKGWTRLKNPSLAILVFALAVLSQRRPLGDLTIKTIEGREIGAFTEWHWDDHVDHTWKWHRGISLLIRDK